MAVYGYSISAAAAGILLLLAGQTQAQQSIVAQAEMIDQKEASVGQVTLQQLGSGVLLKAELTNLPPGWHGFHIHEVGSCAPPFDSSGGHFNPDGEKHGYGEGGPHPGDMPNFYVGSDGKASFEVYNPKVALRSPGASATGAKVNNLLGDKGTAIVVHEHPDDYKSDPAGHAGNRIACGIVRNQ